MANKHFGNLADVFKHLALAEVLGTLSPAEYWESHSGAAFYAEAAEMQDVPPERLHGVHGFLRLATDFAALRTSYYHRVLSNHYAARPPEIPGSPLLARVLLGENVRRLLFCDIDAASLLTIRDPQAKVQPAREVHADKIECVQDDGVTVLRGAGILLPEPWIPSTLALIDPYDIYESTDAGISPLVLACELASRSIPTILFYTFSDEAGRTLQHKRFVDALEKACLIKRGGRWFEGNLRHEPSSTPPATQWGFGLLTFNLGIEALNAVDQKLSALEAAYQRSELPGWNRPSPSGAWRYTHASL